MKKYLYFSLFLNLMLLMAFIITAQSNAINASEVRRIDKARLEDIKSLEILIAGRISKSEVISRLRESTVNPEFFIKNRDDENGIGVSYIFLNFDKKNQLKNIEASSFEGP